MPKYLYRDGDIFLFRRRVPQALQHRFGCKELYRSLKTTVLMVARRRAAALFLASEGLFQMAADFDLTDEDIRAAAQYWMSGVNWQERLELAIDRKPPGVLRAYKKELADNLLEITDEFGNPIPRIDARQEQAAAALHFAGYAEQTDPKVLERVADVLVALIQKRVDDRIQEVFRPSERPVNQREATAPQNSPTANTPSTSPLMSEHIPSWEAALASGWEDRKAISQHSITQYLVAVRLFVEIAGNKRLADVDFDDAAAFRKAILMLPRSHGKGRHVHALEAIKRADAKGEVRMSMKTAKRHHTALNQYWDWLVYKGLIPRNDSPFRGHRFPGAKSSPKDRDEWTKEGLQRIFTSSDYASHPRNTAWHWLPLISLHSGLRLEEICRLRPFDDVREVNGVHCFIIQPHPDGWDPKTEAGSRIVPIHPWLVSHGLMTLVEARTNEGASRLFPELRPQGGKLGAKFSREFSRFKIDLGIGERVVFHSFRHTFRSELEDSDCKDSHIDAVMGHEGGTGGEGKTYTKRRLATRTLQKVVHAFSSPLALDFLNETSTVVPKRKVRRSSSRVGA